MKINDNIALTVPGENQVALSETAFCEGARNGSPRIMFIGNSITRHAPKADVGWDGCWGMAASEASKDYVHLVIAEVKKIFPNAAFCIVNGASWERGQRGCDYEKIFGAARDFAPDYVSLFIGANVPAPDVEYERFKKNIGELLDFVTQKSRKAKFIYCTKFYPCLIRDKAIRDYAAEHGEEWVEMNGIIDDESNLAIGLFEHPGVQGHPGDKGMREIADRIIKKLIPMLTK